MDSVRFNEKYLSHIPALQVPVNWTTDTSKRLLDSLKTQHLGPMQKLLTGQWRLPLASGEHNHV